MEWSGGLESTSLAVTAYKYSFKMNYILKMIYKNDIFRPLAAEEIFGRTNYEGAQRPMDFLMLHFSHMFSHR